jgi:phosphate transport system permease protein
MNVRMLTRLLPSLKKKRKRSLAASILLLVAGCISASFGLIRLFNALSYGFLKNNGNVETLSITFADVIMSLIITLPSLALFVGAYLSLNSDSLGWKLSCVTAVGAISLFFSHFVNSELLLVIGALSAIATAIEISGLKYSNVHNSSVTTEKLGRFAVALSGLICVGILAGMLVYIGIRGERYLSLSFVTGSWSWRHAEDVLSGIVPGQIGGIRDYIIGSFLLVTVCEAVAVPLGLGAAIYLAEYSSDNIITDIVRFFIETLAGVPSIVIGLVGMSLFLWQLHWGTSLLGGGISLAFMILPWNIRIAEEAMKAVPESYREASTALGATQWQTVRKVVLFVSSPGILTGILLGLGSALGETAVVMLTAGMSATTLQLSLTHAAVPSLPVWIYSAQFSLLGGGGQGRIPEVYSVMLTGSFVLVVIFLAICGATLILRNHLTKKITGK